MKLPRKRRELTDAQNRLAVIVGEGFAGGVDWEFADSRCKLLHSEWINNKGTGFNILG